MEENQDKKEESQEGKYKTMILTLNGKKVTVKARICKNLWQQATGKMFSFSKEPLIFIFDKEKHVSIHTYFCFKPLIVIWMTEDGKITRAEKIKPFSKPRSSNAKYIIEIPAKD
jgi:uncharacterized membrane protein (UPF0127 family)